MFEFNSFIDVIIIKRSKVNTAYVHCNITLRLTFVFLIIIRVIIQISIEKLKKGSSLVVAQHHLTKTVNSCLN